MLTWWEGLWIPFNLLEPRFRGLAYPAWCYALQLSPHHIIVHTSTKALLSAWPSLCVYCEQPFWTLLVMVMMKWQIVQSYIQQLSLRASASKVTPASHVFHSMIVIMCFQWKSTIWCGMIMHLYVQLTSFAAAFGDVCEAFISFFPWTQRFECANVSCSNIVEVILSSMHGQSIDTFFSLA